MLLFVNSCARLLMTTFAVIAIAVLTTPAAAQGRRVECTAYAREAVEHFRQSVRLRCNFEGARWSDQREVHFAWCLVTPRGIVEESRIRRRMLLECAAHRGGNGGHRAAQVTESKHASCTTYAKVTSVQADAARKYRCDLHGPEWSTDASLHYHWCLRNERHAVMNQLRDRTEDLQRCFNRLGE